MSYTLFCILCWGKKSLPITDFHYTSKTSVACAGNNSDLWVVNTYCEAWHLKKIILHYNTSIIHGLWNLEKKKKQLKKKPEKCSKDGIALSTSYYLKIK